MLETLNDAGAREGEASAEAEGSVRLMTIHRSKGAGISGGGPGRCWTAGEGWQEQLFLSDDLGVTFKTEPASMLYNLAKFQDADQDKCEALRISLCCLDARAVQAHYQRSRKIGRWRDKADRVGKRCR